jgi:transcriptional regulator with PAS, ATPase and Fis domain
VGETRDVPVDVRVIAATQEPLSSAVADKRFRADLLARLDGLTVVLPPLRERREDIVPLFLGFLAQQGQKAPALEPKLVEAICLYEWPLNVRELGLLARRLIAVHGQEPLLKKAHLPERMVGRDAGSAAQPPPAAAGREKRAWRKVDDHGEFEALMAALREHGGSVGRAAAAIGISRARAYRVLSAHPDFSLDEVRES